MPTTKVKPRSEWTCPNCHMTVVPKEYKAGPTMWCECYLCGELEPVEKWREEARKDPWVAWSLGVAR